MSNRKGRTQRCTKAQAKTRLAHATMFLDVAELVSHELDEDTVEYVSVSASLAVLAAIAASDAACCYALGKRARGQDHHEAEELLSELKNGRTAAKSLHRLLIIKDAAHYGLIHVSAAELRTALRHARKLLVFADDLVSDSD